MAVAFIPEANEEFFDAMTYYESKSAGLGARSLAEVQAATSKIEALPETWPTVSRRCRRVLVDVFPYGLIYQLHQYALYVIAVAHLKRRPGYWRRRELE